MPLENDSIIVFEEALSTDPLVRLALMSRGFEYIIDDYEEECKACQAGTCVQRIEYIGGGECRIVHDVRDELN